MKILADESVDIPVFEHLQKAGYDIIHVSSDYGGYPDTDVLQLAYLQKRTLLTVDKDFGELAFRKKKQSHGIILYRLSGMTNIQKAEIVLKTIRQHHKELHSNFMVITKTQVRIKKLIF